MSGLSRLLSNVIAAVKSKPQASPPSDDPWSSAPPWAIELGHALHTLIQQEITNQMATQQTLDAMKAAVAANTDATKSAADALAHFAQSNADLTVQLATAIANSAASDDADVQAAIAAINANNAALTAAVPAVATAVTANTAPAP